MKRLIRIILHFDQIVTPLLVALILIDVVLQVLSRILPGLNLSWTVQMGETLLGALIWLGISVGIREESHVRFTILSDKLPKNFQTVLVFVNNLLFIAYFSILAFFVVKMIQSFFKLGRIDNLLGVNIGFLRLPMLIGILISTLILIIKQIIFIKKWNR